MNACPVVVSLSVMLSSLSAAAAQMLPKSPQMPDVSVLPVVHIEDVYPSVLYPDTPDRIDVRGTNFAALPEDNIVEFVRQPGIDFGKGEECRGPAYPKPCVLNVGTTDRRRIQVVGIRRFLKSGVAGTHVKVGC